MNYASWFDMDSAARYAEFRKHFASLDEVFANYSVTVTYDQDEREYVARIEGDGPKLNVWFGYADSPAEAIYGAAISRIVNIHVKSPSK
ncbi:hypothetical protein MHB71_05065 [Paenibacillus sp. FSL H7-0940]|uniref:hypothetical protein n=1 Tax=Paenibacillus sp. FSL H7-0940 TaxID=2921443 RepID=UPI0030EBA412